MIVESELLAQILACAVDDVTRVRILREPDGKIHAILIEDTLSGGWGGAIFSVSDAEVEHADILLGAKKLRKERMRTLASSGSP